MFTPSGSGGTSSTLTPANYDEVVLTYNGNGDVATMVFKLATVTVRTITFTYDGSFNLTDAVAA